MLTWALLVKSAVLGFTVAAPIGPIGMLVLQRTLKLGLGKGLASGMGVALADMICAGAVSAGMAAMLMKTGPLSWALKLAGGAYLVWIGVRIWRSAAAGIDSHQDDKGEGAWSILLLTLANPGTWMAYAGAYAAILPDLSGGWRLEFVAGVGAGSALWWCLLGLFADWLRMRLEQGMKTLLFKASGGLIILFGLWGVIQM